MPFSGKRKHPYKFTIYVPPSKERLVKDFIKTFRARNESASQKILDMIQDVMENGRVNPQTRLLNDSKPIQLCSFAGCARVASFTGEYDGTEHYVCSQHQRRVKTNDKWVGWRRLKP